MEVPNYRFFIQRREDYDFTCETLSDGDNSFIQSTGRFVVFLTRKYLSGTIQDKTGSITNDVQVALGPPIKSLIVVMVEPEAFNLRKFSPAAHLPRCCSYIDFSTAEKRAHNLQKLYEAIVYNSSELN